MSQRWRVERDCGFPAFLADARDRWGPGSAPFDRLLWHGGLHLNGCPVDVERPPPKVAAGSWVVAWGFEREPEVVTIGHEAVLWDAEGVVALSKPPWITTQGSRASQRLSLERSLRALLRAPELVAVHRLDRETSGLVLFARGREPAAWLERELRERRVEKRYLVWVSPPPAASAFSVQGWMSRAPHPSRFRFSLHDDPQPGSRWSETRFERLAARGQRALLRAGPRTGRTHQIRVHLAEAGHPVLGDTLYGPRFDPAGPWASDRTLLHAHSLRFRPPGWRSEVTLRAPLPADFPSTGAVRGRDETPCVSAGGGV